MKARKTPRTLFPSQLGLILLASAFVLSSHAQQTESAAGPQSTPSVSVQQQPSPTATPANTDKEGFWGRVNPFARKKWVNQRVDPLKGRIDELDEVNAKNARDIQDVDHRAQAGIHRAQSAADAANQTATAAGSQAQRAGLAAQGASNHVDRLNSTVAGLDQYRESNQIEITFHGGQPILSAAARKQLDEFSTSLTGRQGYVLEIEGHSPQAGSVGIQSSGRLAEAVKRYLVTQHEIPVYRLHSVALGNASSNSEETPVKTGNVRIRLMENSLAAQEVASPQSAASSTGAERP
jgi:outer membrane protein OmpA-like peptidoglycan-associated protein